MENINLLNCIFTGEVTVNKDLNILLMEMRKSYEIFEFGFKIIYVF